MYRRAFWSSSLGNRADVDSGRAALSGRRERTCKGSSKRRPIPLRKPFHAPPSRSLRSLSVAGKTSKPSVPIHFGLQLSSVMSKWQFWPPRPCVTLYRCFTLAPHEMPFVPFIFSRAKNNKKVNPSHKACAKKSKDLELQGHEQHVGTCTASCRNLKWISCWSHREKIPFHSVAQKQQTG